ncbi:MAG: DNA primase, partial [Firmicutes bacterium]|nr:DNA primase [Bacillota bacterium]
MTGNIPRELVEEILDRTDIVALIESYLPLKRQGRNLVGLCPFHLEDTPSFSVSPDKQMFYCFGCQKGGNALTFVMEYEHLTFPEAVQKLAAKAGVTLPERELTPVQEKHYDEKRRLTEINKAAAAFYQQQLKGSEMAVSYLKKRGISGEIAARFHLGFAPDSWDLLKNHLKEQGFSEGDMLKADILSRSESGRIFDRFRNRLMFPICDKKGDFIGFSGRVFDDSKPKYLNTSETPVFYKSQNLFGLHLAYSAMRREEEAFLLEGNVDVVTAHQFGIDNAVAPLGTSFTEDHAKILKRYCDRVIVAFDGDGAGQKATNKALDLLNKVGIRGYAMTIPAPNDPDDFIRANGKEGWDKLRSQALTFMEFKIRLAMSLYDPTTAEGKADILKELVPSLMLIKNMVERTEYIHTIAEKLRISEELILADIRNKSAEGGRDFGSVARITETRTAKGIAMAKDCVLHFAAENRDVFDEIDRATEWNFLETAAQRCVIRNIRKYKDAYSWHFRDLAERAEDDDKNILFTYIMNDPFRMVEDKNKMFRDCWKTIRKDALMKEKDLIQERIKECEKCGNNGELEILLRNFA